MEVTASRETLKVDDCSDPNSRGIKRSANLSIDVCQKQCKEEKDETGPTCTKRQSSTSVNSQQNKLRLRKVAYVWNEEMGEVCDLLPRVPQRASKVHALIAAYGLLRFLLVLDPLEAKKDHLLTFHSQEYVDFLEFLNDEDDSEKEQERKEEFGMNHDCPSVPRIFDVAKSVTAASLRGVQALVSNECQVAINWTGGWHHGRRDEAAGFCYMNDVVISLLQLTQTYKRVLYIDLDLHHGDAVQDAFAHTPKVMTVSFHKHSPGFYPGSGNVDDVGHGRGRYYSVNLPLQDGMTDVLFFSLFKGVLMKVQKIYQPSVVVIQCGADTLVGDHMNCFNLTPSGIANCVNYILHWNIPTLLLGGGGYNTPNTARCWTLLTAVAVGVRLNSEIPDHEFFLDYGPDYQLEISPSNRQNLNTKQYLSKIVPTIFNNLDQLKPVSKEK